MNDTKMSIGVFLVLILQWFDCGFGQNNGRHDLLVKILLSNAVALTGRLVFETHSEVLSGI